MALTINTNISALNAQRQLESSQSSMNKAMERLSSGLRINSAKDDAAGLAISDRMTAQIRGLNQAVRNANDGISLAQTAEGGMQEMTNILQRMREIAVQASNDTNTAEDRLALQGEMDQLFSELDRIAESTQFNGSNILDGSKGTSTFQIGANAGQTLDIEIDSVTTNSLNLNGFSALGELNTGRTLDASGLAVGDVQINGFNFATSAVVGTAASGIATAINTNTTQHGVTATAYNTLTSGTSTGVTTGALTINGDTIAASGSTEELVSNINRDAAGVTAVLNSDNTITLSNDTGADIVIGGTVTGSGFATGTSKGFVALSNQDGSAISVTLGTTGTTADIQALGLNLSTGSDSVTSGNVSTTALTAAMDVEINGVQIGASASGSASDKAAAINAVEAQSGVEATAFTEVAVEFHANVLAAGADVTINGTNVDLSAATSLTDVVTAINGAGIQGIVASSNVGGDLVLTSATGLDISLQNDATIDLLGAGTDQSGTVFADQAAGAAAATVSGRITLTGADGADVRIGGTTADIAHLGLVAQGGSEDVVGSGLSVTSAASAGIAINRIDDALQQIDSSRADLGAVQNRFESTISNLQNVSQNLSAARSRIVDADFAAETTALSRAQILQQAGTAMLAQANASQQGVLSLLG